MHSFPTFIGYLTQWYVVDAKKADNARLALPDSAFFSQGSKQHVICGLLESRDGTAPISFELRQPVYWCVDRKHCKRGIWVTSSTGAWYWLKQPDATQEALHLPLRAKLGLLSNILNVFMEEQDGLSFYYAEAHLQMSPEAVHERLLCSNDDFYAQYNTSSLPLSKAPWDMDLFWHSLPFLKSELRANVCTGWDKSVFWKVLCKMKPPKAKTNWTPTKYLESAKLAERRAQQLPWGEPLAHAKRIRPNWMMEAMIQATAMDHTNSEPQLSRERPAAHEDSSDDDYVESKKKPLKRKRTIHDDSSDDDDNDNDDDESPNKKQRLGLEDSARDDKPLARKRHTIVIDDSEDENQVTTPAEEAKYSAKRMVHALVSTIFAYTSHLIGCASLTSHALFATRND
jgi:hypothetical protein